MTPHRKTLPPEGLILLRILEQFLQIGDWVERIGMFISVHMTVVLKRLKHATIRTDSTAHTRQRKLPKILAVNFRIIKQTGFECLVQASLRPSAQACEEFFRVQP